MRNLRLKGDPFLRVFYPIEVDAVLVSEGVEDVHVLYGLLTSLLVAVDQIDPVIDVFRDVPILQFFPEAGNKQKRIAVGPFGQYDVVDLHFLLGESILVVILIDEHLGQSVQLGDEFADIGGTGDCVMPRTTIVVEDTVCAVEFPALKCKCADAVWPYADEVVEYDGR